MTKLNSNSVAITESGFLSKGGWPFFNKKTENPASMKSKYDNTIDRPLYIIFWICILITVTSCDSRVVVMSEGVFELIQNGADMARHNPGNQQLWYVPNAGKRTLVWSYVVSSPEIIDGSVVFSGGLSDDRRWRVYPAVLAFSPGGAPVEITEFITAKYGVATGIPYASIAGGYRYQTVSASKQGVKFLGMRLPESSVRGALSIDISISSDEISNWIQKSRKTGDKKNYGGVTFIVPRIGD